MNCSVCTIVSLNVLSCNICNFCVCKDCQEKYIMMNNNNFDCMNCHKNIEYNNIIKLFGKKWLFNNYMNHKTSQLFNSEMKKIPMTLNNIINNKKINKLKKNIKALLNKKKYIINRIKKFKNKILMIKNNKLKNIIRCPDKKCLGIIDNNRCFLCKIVFCSYCFSYNDVHTEFCNNRLKQLLDLIKAKALNCPNCGIIIIKDETSCKYVECVECKTLFDSSTNIIFKNTISNIYINKLDYITFVKDKYSNDDFSYLNGVYHHIMEFLLFQKKKLLEYNNNNHNHLKYRIKFINNYISESEFKNYLYKQNKRIFFNSIIIHHILSVYNQAIPILMNIYYNKEDIEKLKILIKDANISIQKISKDFNYSKYPIIYHWFNLKLNIKLNT
jgi:hypothetical protein